MDREVLSIDVSSTAIGFAFSSGRRVKTAWDILLAKKDGLGDRLRQIREHVADAIFKNRPDLVIVEAPVTCRFTSMVTIRALFAAAGVVMEAVRACGVQEAIMVQPDWWQKKLIPMKHRPAEWKTMKSKDRRSALKAAVRQIVIDKEPHLQVLLGPGDDGADAAGMLLAFLDSGHELM